MKKKKYYEEATEREILLVNFSNNLEVVRPYEYAINVEKYNGKEYIWAILKTKSRCRKRKINLSFHYSSRKRITDEDKRECQNYLKSFIGGDFVINRRNERQYSPAMRGVTRSVGESWYHTIGFYTLLGQKIPSIIRSGFDIKDLKKISKKCKKKDFCFD